MRKLTLKELEELNQINNNEIYRLRRIITQQGKDIASKEKVIDTIEANDYDFTTEGKIY